MSDNGPLGQSATRLPASAVLLRTARAALKISAEEMADAAGCGVDLVRRVESGEHDPVIDTVGRLVSAVGLELRCGNRGAPNPAYLQVCPEEVNRVAFQIAKSLQFRMQFGCGLPKPMHQTDWDGVPPAPPHLFGAGTGRRHGGGWAALLLLGLRWEVPDLKRREIVKAAGINEDAFEAVESGEHRPPMGEFQKLLHSFGRDLYVRLEVYDEHDDQLHHSALEEGIDQYERRLELTKRAWASMVSS